MEPQRQLFGRCLEDFEIGRTYAHPWEVTVDSGLSGVFSAAFLDAMPTFASTAYAQALGFRDRPVHPLLLLNLALSFSVHDISEQCIAHLAYLNIRFPRAVYLGDTLRAASTCTDITPAKNRATGVVQVRTCLFNQVRQPVCWLERKVQVPGGSLHQRPYERFVHNTSVPDSVQPLPPELAMLPPAPSRDYGFTGHFEDFAVGQVFFHQAGHTLDQGQAQMLASGLRNTHPLHANAAYCEEAGLPRGQLRIMGGLIFAWAAALTSRDLCGNSVWELGYEDGSHPTLARAGETLYAASKVLSLASVGEDYGALQTRLVALRNVRPEALITEVSDLFKPEHQKPKGQRLAQKALEVTRRVLVRRRP